MGSELAILGGPKTRTKEFRSRPLVGQEEIDLVSSLMRSGNFSKFVGSPIDGTRELLTKKSQECSQQEVGFNFLGGQFVRNFESLWSGITNADYCISVNSATSGLTTALLSLGMAPGSKVVTSPFSFTATSASIVSAHCVPIFCDIDPETFCLSPEHLRRLVLEHDIKCIVPVHWCGNAGDLEEICLIAKENSIFVVEDAAQAPDTFYKEKALGTYGDAGVFSFNEPKNLMTGEGGLILTNNVEIAKKCRLIRNHGEAIVNEDDDLTNIVGYNFRMTEIHAAIAWIQSLNRKKINNFRNNNYKYLTKKIKEKFSNFLIPQKITHPESYFSYTAAFRWNKNKAISKKLFAEALMAEGIPVFAGYKNLLSDQPLFKKKIAFGSWPFSETNVDYGSMQTDNARNLLDNEFIGFFQMGWPNTEDDMDDILKAIDKILTNKDDLIDIKLEEDFKLGR